MVAVVMLHLADICWAQPGGLAAGTQCSASSLPDFYFVEPVGALQDFAGLAAVGRADDDVALHAIQDAGGAAVAQA